MRPPFDACGFLLSAILFEAFFRANVLEKRASLLQPCVRSFSRYAPLRPLDRRFFDRIRETVNAARTTLLRFEPSSD